LTLARLLARLGRLRESVIVFTEYRDTLLHVRDRVAPGAVLLHGGLSREERCTAIAEFVSGRRTTLLATDAAGEGLNLHESCRVVVNLELPWNPMRLEQRIGRVDRLGQKRTVHAVHLIAADTGEARILARLRYRLERARAEVGAPDPLGWLLDNDQAALGSTDGVHLLEARPWPANDVDASPVPWTLGCLTSEAEAEYARLRLARLMRTASDESAKMQSKRGMVSEIGADRWLLFNRRSRLRRVYRPSLIALFRTAIEDSYGRLIATHLTPVVIRTARRMTKSDGDVIRGLLETVDLERLDPTVSYWTDASIRLHRAFWSRRAARERAIARAVAPEENSMYQAGLFDRRAVTDHEKEARARAEVVAEAERQAAAAVRAAEAEATSSSPVLVLVV